MISILRPAVWIGAEGFLTNLLVGAAVLIVCAIIKLADKTRTPKKNKAKVF